MLDNFSDSYKIRCGYSILCNDGVEIRYLGGSHILGGIFINREYWRKVAEGVSLLCNRILNLFCCITNLFYCIPTSFCYMMDL